MRGARTAIVLVILAVAIGAAVLRLPRLALRPMHGDEANQAVKTATLLETGVYRYDPYDHHGPSLYYLALPVLWASGDRTAADISEATLRAVPAVFGVLVVVLLLLLVDGLGKPAAAVAAILSAGSPALVFYSRYYVQEMLLVFFTLATIATAWRYVVTRKGVWAAAAGACLGLMYATKETWVLAGAAMVGALALTLLWERYGAKQTLHLREVVTAKAVTLALAAAVVVAVVLYTSFFTHARGPLDSVLTYWYNVVRVGGESYHDHEPLWYLKMLAFSRWVTGTSVGPWWSEGLILVLALAGLGAALTGRGLGSAHRGLARFLGLYTILLTAGYSAISYKTPWCASSFLQAMTLMAGLGAVALVRWTPTRPLKVLLVLVLAAGTVHLAWQAHRGSFRFCVDQRNPYVYAHTAPDAERLAARVEEVAEVSPRGRGMVVKVITPTNYWPLPWYLRRFKEGHVGYYHEVPAHPDADNPGVIITTLDCMEAIDARIRTKYNTMCQYGLRPGVVMVLYIREPLWDALVKKWSAPKDETPAVQPTTGQGGGA